MNKTLSSKIADLQRELANLEREYRQADAEWRLVEAECVRLKRLREELDLHKCELSNEIEWRTRELAALQEAVKHARATA